MKNFQEQEQQTLQDEYIGTDKNGTYRPDITLENLDVSRVDKTKIIDNFCNCVKIPIIITEEECIISEFMFCYLVDRVASGFNDVKDQPINLFLIVDDNSGERRYYIGADVQLEDWDGTRTETSIEEIHPVIEEQAAIELALLKITNPEQFLLRYTRCQVAQRPEIMNKYGFFGDCILNDGSYRSEWMREECIGNKKQYTYLNVYISNVRNEHSKIQFLPIGVSDKINM